MENSNKSHSKIGDILLIVWGATLITYAIFNQPSELLIYLGLTNQLFILLLSFIVLAIPAIHLEIYKKSGDKFTFVIGLTATFGLQLLGRGSLITIIGLIFIVISATSYYLAKKKRILF